MQVRKQQLELDMEQQTGSKLGKTLALKDGSNITGNLHIRRLHVELGATFNGSCKTITESEFDKLTGTAAPAKAQQPAVQAQHQNPAQAHAN